MAKQPMTEQEWLECVEPQTLLKKARFRNSRRKSRLFAVACCRCIWPQFVDDRSRAAVEIAERHADGLATDDELCSAAREAHEAHAEVFAVLGKVGSTIEWAAGYAANANPFHAAKNSMWMARFPRACDKSRERPGQNVFPPLPCVLTKRTGPLAALWGAWKITIVSDPIPTGADCSVECHLIRDIFGNPFRPVSIEPSWRTFDVMALSRQMYESRDFSSMPILADALQDAGCSHEAVLNHCRVPGEHVRGCWIVDSLLGKE